MSLHARVLTLWLVLAAVPARAEVVEIGATVVKVAGDGAKRRVTIDKGKKAGLKVGTTGELFPRHETEGSTVISVDFNVRVATGKVVELKDDSAVLSLDAVADKIEQDQFFSYEVDVPTPLAQSPLFRVTALGVELRPQGADLPYITVEQMLADPSQALQDKTLDAMIKGIKDMRSTVVEYMKDRIEGGKFHGKTAGEVVDALDRGQMRDFLIFVEGFPGKYIGHHWNVPEVYFTWVINGTPSGEKDRAERAVRSTAKAAREAVKAGKLDEARALWEKALKTAPDYKEATDAVSKIDRIAMLARQAADDADDTASLYTLADSLYNLGAYDLAMKRIEVLRTKKYDAFKVDKLRGYTLVRLKKWAEADALFARLVKEHADDKVLGTWSTYIKAEAKIAKSPNDATAHFELAHVNMSSKAWDSALAEYRKVLEAKNATPKQRDEAKAAQERISQQKELDQRVVWARENINDHDITKARDRLAQAMHLTDKLGDAKRAGEILDELANLARANNEEELALELLGKRVEAVPDSMAAHAALAFALLGFDRIDEAEKAAKKSLEQKGDAAYSHLILSYVAEARNDLGEAEKEATKASANSPKYAWPLLVLARMEAAKGNWEQSIAIAKKALELDDTDWEMRSTLGACSRGLQAAEALAADPKSARERLRLVRALAELGLVKLATDELNKLPADGKSRPDAWWSIAESPDARVMLKDRLTAARNAKPSTPIRQRKLAELEARTKLRANSKDDDTRIALAKILIQEDDFDGTLTVLVPLMVQPIKPAVGDLVRDAREAIAQRARIELGQAAAARRDFDTANRLYLAAQAVHDRIGTQSGRLFIREVRADALSDQGKYAEATKILTEARAFAVADGAPTSISIIDQRLARLKANVGTNEALVTAVGDALVLAEDLDDETSLYYSHIQLSQLESDEGRSNAALDHARKAWNMAERTGRSDLARNARFQLADANLSSNRFSDAEQLAQALLVDCRKHEDVANEQLALMVLGFVAMMEGQGKPARARFQEVYDLGTRTGQTWYRAHARRFEGMAWLTADHDPAKAIAALEQADALYATLGEGWVESRVGVLRDLADARLQTNKTAAARQAAEQAASLAQRFQRRPALAFSEWMLALVSLKENKASDALKHAQAAVDLAEKTDDTALLWNAWHALARAKELGGKDSDAVDAYEKALDHLTKALVAAGGDTERQGYMNTGRVRDLYKDAVALLLKVGKTSRAMEILELSRDAQLKQMFDPTKIQTKDPKVRAALEKYAKTRARVQGLEKQLDQAMQKAVGQSSDAQVKALSEQIAKTRQELNQVVLDLKVSNRHLFQALAMDPQNLVGRRNELPKGSVLVEYFVAEDALYAFVISASLQQPAVVRTKVTSAELEEATTDFVEAIVTEGEKIKHDPKDAEKVIALGRKLDAWLLEPLRPHLKDATTVVILPFGQLYFLPFDALVSSAPGEPVHYAVEDYRISIQTATTLEHLLEPQRARSNGTMLAISNPDGSLPGAQREVARIVKSAVPDAHVLVKKEATLKKFQDLAGGFRYIHLATHGILDPDPRKSYLKLADGPLTVEQISQLQGLDQSNELVVLSACDTANEEGHSTGDELISLAVAFAMAGSPTLVASLWEVGDDSTAELMATFYRALTQNTGDRLEALRAAKLNLLRAERGNDKPFAPPWHWASFQMYGDFRGSAK